MCFVHKHMQNADFGQNLSRRASTKRCVTSRPMVRFSQTWYQKMRKTWKKKVIKRRVAISGGRDAVADFVQGGGGQIDPPPVKIGLKVYMKFRSGFSFQNPYSELNPVNHRNIYLRPGSRALNGFYALLCYLNLISKHSDTKWGEK